MEINNKRLFYFNLQLDKRRIEEKKARRKMKKIISVLLTLAISFSTSTYVFAEDIQNDDATSTESLETYTIKQFTENNTALYRKYLKLTDTPLNLLNECDDTQNSFAEIESFDNEPDLMVIDSSTDNMSTAVIFKDIENEKFIYIAQDSCANNLLLCVESDQYLVNEDNDNINLISEEGDILPLVQVSYDPYYENTNFEWLEKYSSERAASGTWNLISSNKYVNTQVLTVQILSIVVSVVTSGVASAHLNIDGVGSKILAYVGIGWTIGQVFTQNYLLYATQWYNSSCKVYYRTKYDYYVVPKSSNGSEAVAQKDFYKYHYTLNVNPSSIPAGCSGFSNYIDGPYSYH